MPYKREDVQRWIEELLQDAPSQVFLDMGSLKREHTEWMVANFRGFFEYFEPAFNLLTSLVKSLNYCPRGHWPEHRILQFVFMPGVLKSLYRAFDDLLEGFYHESLMLLRSVYETVLRIVFVSCYPQDRWATLTPPPFTPKGMRRFNATNFLPHDLNIDWSWLYRPLSMQVHSRQPEVLERIMAVSQGQLQLHALELSADEELAGLAMNSATFLLWLLIRLSRALFLDAQILGGAPDDPLRRIRTADRVLRAVCEAHPKAFSRAVPEADLVLRVVQAAELGLDWRLYK